MRSALLLAASLTGFTHAAPFTSDWESLKTYECPEWFRDAKFGIWSHWGPQSVPMYGDWYAKRLFEQGHKQNKHFIEHYGHPAEKGWESVIPQWQAEKFDPEKLMALYQRAGAKYFVSMAVHHDNFDLWDSKHHRWNAVAMGPKRDIVGAWAKAARNHGLKFGVSEHLGASFTWWQVSRGADKTGPKAGVSYIGNNPEFADLYHAKAQPGDNKWYTTNPAFHQIWNKRITDLVTNYKPDLLYSDGGLPFGAIGRKLVAKHYNNHASDDGKTQSVYACKSHHGNFENEQYVDGTCVHDIERGAVATIAADPWQTDTSIGDWFYNSTWQCQRSDGTKGMYRDAGWVIRMLADIVSKNGNLLLNVIQRPDGSLDPDAEKTVTEIGDWMAINGEAIHGTRPWKVFGEGPGLKIKGGGFKEDYPLGANDIRFTTKKNAVYAIFLGKPDEKKIQIANLASPAGKVDSLTILGISGKIEWRQTKSGLEITLPSQAPALDVFVVKLNGDNLAAVGP
ncbi:MAG: alpha-L-fucosidase [Verrucomicrobiota bacterium]